MAKIKGEFFRINKIKRGHYESFTKQKGVCETTLQIREGGVFWTINLLILNAMMME